MRLDLIIWGMVFSVGHCCIHRSCCHFLDYHVLTSVQVYFLHTKTEKKTPRNNATWGYGKMAAKLLMDRGHHHITGFPTLVQKPSTSFTHSITHQHVKYSTIPFEVMKRGLLTSKSLETSYQNTC